MWAEKERWEQNANCHIIVISSPEASESPVKDYFDEDVKWAEEFSRTPGAPTKFK
jgi:hypothetical protein